MSFEPAPEGLGATLLDLGLHLGVPLGSGSRGTVWSAVGADGVRWAVSVLAVRSAMHAARLQERATRLAGVGHEHLARVGAALPLPDGRLAVLHRAVEGTDLATLHRARERWSPGEVVTVVVPLAGALHALHAAGLSHGDVSPANVVLSDGRPVLIDVLTGDDPLEQGTPGFAAPERHRGARPPGDVHALARLGLTLLGPATDDARAAAVAAVLAAACGPDPDGRPDAAALAEDVFAACPPEPVRDVDPAVLARLSLRRLASDDPARTQRRQVPPRGRHRRRRPRRSGVVGVGLLVALLTGTVGVTSAWRAAVEQRGDTSSTDLTTGGAVAAEHGSGEERGTAPAAGSGVPGAGRAVPVDVPAATAAVRLTHHRAEALLAGDAARLSAVTVPGSPAAVTDLGVLASVGQALDAVAPGSVRTHVVDVDVEPLTTRSAARWGRDCRAVRLVASVRGMRESAAAASSDAPAVPVRLTLCAVAGGWRVAAVETVVA